MNQIIDKSGFVEDSWAGVALCDAPDGAAALLLPADGDAADLAAHLADLRLIVIPFDHNSDGRGFSLAARLRALGYRGHLRARGHVLVDQFRAALRSGFDDVEISAAQAARTPEAQWRAVPFAPGYQARIFSQPVEGEAL